jgi:hypothetical protein
MVGICYAFIGGLFFIARPSTTLVISHSFQHTNQEPLVQPATKVVSIKNEVAVAEQ